MAEPAAWMPLILHVHSGGDGDSKIRDDFCPLGAYRLVGKQISALVTNVNNGVAAAVDRVIGALQIGEDSACVYL